MEVNFSKSAVKFLERLEEKNKEQIREKILALLSSIEDRGVIPFKDLDIKKLKGNWDGFLRMRVGKIRVIFTVDNNSDELSIYEIDFRGDVYKK
jgi:mRNA interferase RelE/StbE